MKHNELSEIRITQILLIVCNFYKNERKFNYQSNHDFHNIEILLSNYDGSGLALSNLHLRPYEAVIYKIF